MKVLYSIPGLAINADAPWVTRARAGGMIAAGLDVTLLVRNQSDREYFSGMPCEILVEEEGGAETAVYRGRPSLVEFIAKPARTQWMAWDVARRIGADVLYFSHPEPWSLLPAACLRGCRGRRPAVAMFATCVYYHPQMPGHYPFHSLVRNWMNLHATRLLNRRMAVIFDNHHVPPFFGLGLSDNRFVIRDGYRDDAAGGVSRAEARRRLSIDPGSRMLLSFGVASKTKGQDLLLEALRGVEPSFEVYLVGLTGGVYSDPAMSGQDLRDGPWKDRIHFISSHVTDDEMVDYFVATDGVILPYRHGFISTSGNFRMAVEYGRAVIASDQYFIGEMVRSRNLGLLFPPEDVPAMRQALVEFGGKSAEWFETVARNARRFAVEESWREVGGHYRKLFTTLVG